MKPLAVYLASIPERILRSSVAVASGIVREAGEIAIPGALRRTRLYRNLVDSTLRFLIEQVGEVDGAFPAGEKLPSDFLLRRTAGNGLEAIGLLTFHASPVWVLAALADVSGAGRQLISDIAAELKREGLLEQEAMFETVDQVLDGLERTSGRMADAVNTPPLNTRQLRRELDLLRADARDVLPSADELLRTWQALTFEAAAQARPVWELSSVMALSALRTAAVRTASALLDHYSGTLAEIHQTGYVSYLRRELAPYLSAAVRQFSPGRRSLTERLLDRW